MATDVSRADLAKLLDAVTHKLSDLTTATKRVFNTPELAEAIFVQCDFNGLLVAQRVCRDFKHLTHTSITLRRKLHLAPLQADYLTILPALPAHMRASADGALLSGEPYITFTMNLDQTKEERSSFNGDYIHPSWGAMSPTQPPVQRLMYRLRCPKIQYAGKGRELCSADGLGITLIQMQSAAQAWNDEHLKVGCRYKVCKPGERKEAYFSIRAFGIANTTSKTLFPDGREQRVSD